MRDNGFILDQKDMPGWMGFRFQVGGSDGDFILRQKAKRGNTAEKSLNFIEIFKRRLLNWRRKVFHDFDCRLPRVAKAAACCIKLICLIKRLLILPGTIPIVKTYRLVSSPAGLPV